MKGKPDAVSISGISLLPMGGGNFIIPLKAELRKKLRENKGVMLEAQLVADANAYEINQALLECLKDSPAAASGFAKLTRLHQNYFNKWIDSAKREITKTKRIAQVVEALERNISYADMIRKSKEEKRF